MKEKLEATLVGVAGEYLVAGELSLRGYIACPSRKYVLPDILELFQG